MIRAIGSGLLLLSAVEATAFVVLYWWTARWWRSETGRSVMTLMMVIAAVLDLSAVRAFVPTATGDAAWFALLRLAVFAFVPIVLGMFLWLLYRLQIRKRRSVSEMMNEDEMRAR